MPGTIGQNEGVDPDQRFILLGASNLTLGLPRIIKAIQDSSLQRTEVFAAHGHGRSFLKWSYVVVRGLPGIRDCALWDDLARRPTVSETYALITDLGNDLIYGYQPEALIDVTVECLQRLSEMGAKIIYARPPLARIDQLTPRQYGIVKNLFFPGPTVPWERIHAAIHQVDEAVLRIAAQYNVTAVTPQLAWYGLDPIHILRKKRPEAWSQILSGWQVSPPLKVNSASQLEHVRTWLCRPHARSICGLVQRSSQPTSHWGDDSSLWVY